MRGTNKRPQDLRVGQLVTTDYERGAEQVVRRVMDIKPDKRFESGYMVNIDGGESCPHCLRPFAKPIRRIDAAWAIPWEAPE